MCICVSIIGLFPITNTKSLKKNHRILNSVDWSVSVELGLSGKPCIKYSKTVMEEHLDPGASYMSLLIVENIMGLIFWKSWCSCH